MKGMWALLGSVVAVIGMAALVLVFWQGRDPLAGVETIAIESLDWQEASQAEIIQGAFFGGLNVVLENRNIAIVGNVDEADAVLAIKEIELGEIEVLIYEGGVKGRASATCVLTDLETGEEAIFDFYLTFYLTNENEMVEAKLVPRKLWQFWK